MSETMARTPDDKVERNTLGSGAPETRDRPRKRRRSASRAWRVLGVLVTLGVTGAAAVFGWSMWQAYMGTPWTRDATVRVYVVTVAPEIAGRVVELPVVDNQLVHKNDLLLKIDPRDYKIAVDLAQASVDQAKADLDNKQAQAARRLQLTDLAATAEERETYVTAAKSAQATLEEQQANLEKAKVNLERTEVRSPVNGWITNLQTQQGDYADTGVRSLTIVNSDSFWIDAYLEETLLGQVKEGDPAKVWLLGYPEVIQGHVDSLARGINVANATANAAGLASVNPVFTWVRLAQRVPVRIHLDTLPSDVRLVAGMTATIEITPRAAVLSSPPP